MDQNKKVGIVYSRTFDDFLESLHDETRAQTIKKAIEDFADGFKKLDVIDCKHFENREKIGILDGNVVVYYDIKDNDWILIGGLPWFPRVA